MTKATTEMTNRPKSDLLHMLNDTSQLLALEYASQLSSAAEAVQSSNALTDDVEFWNWMSRNFKNICHSNDSMQQYILQSATKENWMTKQAQGKGYEWDWMTKQRKMGKNVFKKYDAGDIANRAASDISETNLISGNTKEYQMKAYTSKNRPHLKNTPKDMTVVTNAEKASLVKSDGYQKTESFQDKKTIQEATNKRMKQIRDGRAYTSYNIKNVSATMAKAGLIGCITGIGIEAIASYHSWKDGNLSDREYLKAVLAAGVDSALTAGATSGILIPISAAITVAGASTLITIPIAFIISGTVNKIIAPCFGRGQYQQLLSTAKYYQSLESVYEDLRHNMQRSCEQYSDFIFQLSRQNTVHQTLKVQSMQMNHHLETIYNSI